MPNCKWCDCSFGIPGQASEIEHSVFECRAILEAKLRNANLQIRELEQKVKDSGVVGFLGIETNRILRERDDALRLVSEMRTALEIASPSMVHTYSGHTYEDGKPVEWVDGCGKCRVMKLLAPDLKRNHEQDRNRNDTTIPPIMPYQPSPFPETP